MNLTMLNLAGLMLAGAVATVAVGCSGGDQQQMQQMAPSIATITLAEGTSDLESSFQIGRASCRERV